MEANIGLFDPGGELEPYFILCNFRSHSRVAQGWLFDLGHFDTGGELEPHSIQCNCRSHSRVEQGWDPLSFLYVFYFLICFVAIIYIHVLGFSCLGFLD